MALSAPGDVEWVRTAEVFLNAKLKGKNIGKAPNLGHIMDGVVLAFDDHPSNFRASLKATVGLLKSCRDAHSRYVAWCLVDAVLKQSTVPALKQELLKLLPELVNTELPVGSGSGKTTPADGAYLLCYLAILRTWTEQAVIPLDLLPMVETYLKSGVDVQQTSENASGGRKSTGGAAALKGDAGRIASIMGDMKKGQQQQGGRKHLDAKTQEATSDSKAAAAAVAQQPVGKAMVERCVAALYDPNRTSKCCYHCGAVFSTEEARSLHQAGHFVSNENTAAIRLYYPTTAQFTQHVPQHQDTGKVVQCVLPANEAEKQNFRPLLSSGGVDTSRGKRGRDGATSASGVKVRDLSQVYSCAVCHQKVQPSLDSNQNWVLDGCIQTGGPGQIAHKACV